MEVDTQVTDLKSVTADVSTPVSAFYFKWAKFV